MPWTIENQRASNRQHYRDNKKYYTDKATVRRKALRAKYRAYKRTLKCARCPENHPACLDFHHECDKDLDITSAMKHGWSWKRLLTEINKCIILCANCHRKLHHEQWSGSSMDEHTPPKGEDASSTLAQTTTLRMGRQRPGNEP